MSGRGEAETLQSRLEVSEDGEPEGLFTARSDATIADPAALLAHLDHSGHFHRDGPPRPPLSSRHGVPARERRDLEPARLDRRRSRQRPCRRGVAAGRPIGPLVELLDPRALVHNLAGMAQDAMSLLRGRQGDHRCVLNCEWAAREALDARSPRPSRAGTCSSRRGSPDRSTPRGCARRWGRCSARSSSAIRSRSSTAPTTRPWSPRARGCRASRGDRRAAAAAGRARAPPRGRHAHVQPQPRGRRRSRRDAGPARRGASVRGRAAVRPLDFLALRDLPVRPVPPSTAVPVVRAYERAVELLGDLRARPARHRADGGEDERGHGFHLAGCRRGRPVTSSTSRTRATPATC